jgi:hypothetical protein
LRQRLSGSGDLSGSTLEASNKTVGDIIWSVKLSDMSGLTIA